MFDDLLEENGNGSPSNLSEGLLNSSALNSMDALEGVLVDFDALSCKAEFGGSAHRLCSHPNIHTTVI